MDFDEYKRARNEVIDHEYAYRAYRHTARRLWERFGIPISWMRMAVWEQKSYACARRLTSPIAVNDYAMFFRESFFGHNVVWVYNRKQRCIVSAYTMDMVVQKNPEVVKPWLRKR